MASKRMEESPRDKRLETFGLFAVSWVSGAMTIDQIEGYQALGGLGHNTNALSARVFERGFNLSDIAARLRSGCVRFVGPCLANFDR